MYVPCMYNVLSNLENGLLFTVTFLHLQFFLLSSLFVVVFSSTRKVLETSVSQQESLVLKTAAAF